MKHKFDFAKMNFDLCYPMICPGTFTVILVKRLASEFSLPKIEHKKTSGTYIKMNCPHPFRHTYR